MNVLKNFEALFVVTLGLACAANYVLDSGTATATEAQLIVARANAPAIAAAKDMQVVVVSAKRPSAEQKLQLLNEERKANASAKI
ncbi:hypothetical protein [Pseudoduganella aquatica]|uniref:DUF4398 domain-containing protein n=1 Tax=Pseudoduganella aquatica TaxID=2660641 RepID=A0A7X4HB96_9BURK|nr:hypothetical protein [Pseudoduganella aquatica]MYN07995.1 hypothetical protein [Pseudoduganella aquatica]